MQDVSYVNFLKVCLENSRSIMQRKKIYKKDFDFIMISLKLSSNLYEHNKEDLEIKELYKKFLLILDLAYDKFHG